MVIDLFVRNDAQMARIAPRFPLAHGVPALTIAVSTAASSTSSSVVCNGKMHRMARDGTRRSIIASSAGAAFACSTESSWGWPAKVLGPSAR